MFYIDRLIHFYSPGTNTGITNTENGTVTTLCMANPASTITSFAFNY
jgi:hypothetical protein